MVVDIGSGGGVDPYYSDDFVTIYHGDCREILPSLVPADVVVADPPYGVGLGYDVYDDSAANLEALIIEVFPLMTAAAPVVAVTPGTANIHRWPAPKWTLAWVPDNSGAGSTAWGFPCWQPVLAYGKDPYLARGLGRRPDVIRNAPSADEFRTRTSSPHPCPKPMSFWKRLIVRVSPAEGETIIDPFLGSGTTVEAARALNRKAIGIDLSERYCEMAANRCTQEVMVF